MTCPRSPAHARRVLLSCLGLLGVLVVAPRTADAIPAFARKYGFDCSMCHSSYPRLNDLGARFRDNGYRLPGLESEERTVFEGPTPLALRTSVGFDLLDRPGKADDQRRFVLNGLDVLSAGVLSQRLSYVLVYTPPISEARGLAAQDATLEIANVVLADVLPRLSVRVGRFEPAYVALSVKRRLTVSPYEVYDQAFADGAPLSETQEGLELSTRLRQFALSAGWVNGASSNLARDVPSDFYARISAVFGAGEGQTAGQRVGLFGYLGRARPASTTAVLARETFARVGFDASLNLRGVNLGVVAIWERDSGELWQATKAQNSLGGLAELSYTPTPRVAGFLRWDAVLPDDAMGPDLARITAGGRYHLVSNLALHLEYTHSQQGKLAPFAGTRREDFATARLDLAF